MRHIKDLRLPCRFIAASGSMGPAGNGWHPLQRYIFYSKVTPTTKTVTLHPRRGNSIFRAYRLFLREQSCVNALALGNRGIHHLITHIIPTLSRPSIVSAHASDSNEAAAICRVLASHKETETTSQILAIEVNLSCPNVQQIRSEEMLAILEPFALLPWPIIAKIGHQAPYLDMVPTAALHDLIDCVSAINSVPWSTIFPDCKSPLQAYCGQSGGVSGKWIKPFALQTITELRIRLHASGLPDFPIIGGGGISSVRDVKDFSMAGASYFSIGSSLNMPNLWRGVLKTLRTHN